METEIWKPINGGEGYEVSNFGNVRSYRKRGGTYKTERPRPITLKTHGRNKRYKAFNARNESGQKTIKVHRCVAIAFIPNDEGKPFVNHIDMNPSNNHVSNLEWVTHIENVMHAKMFRNNGKT